ncbi:zinc-dependent alcohol dehydrogenase family protein [Arsenicicoccus piscis]|uniref:zinc-dependent alcohol dehydrogenase family protein n=1 Tax=Arsenicicoccus piscis TaxID=673954 RepID=UPI001F4D0FEB|nr:zinc-dependent alcohol dehydrogenase family protein [Arsenicicoccus piscis]MCH8626254.1 zinc-dependent alcohol dehydrogenase family protein [Arsenicicoccus piscis]
MRATVLHAPGDIRLEEVPEPTIMAPTDAIVRVTAACICGSDLWPYRGASPVTEPRRIGHELIGVVEAVGPGVSTMLPGTTVISPFTYSDSTCAHCRAGVQSACEHGGYFGANDRDGHLVDGCQGELVRVPLADGTLVPVRGEVTDDNLASLLTLSDVMGTGWHAAVSAGVSDGMTVAVVGDGAVGLCGVLAARELGAARIVALSRHEARQQIATHFGATDIVAERGDEATERLLDLTDGVGADAVLECVGTAQSMETAFAIARPGSIVGFVGVPHGGEPPVERMFRKNIGLRGGMAPVRRYLPHLVPQVLDGRIEPGLVFDSVLPLDEVAEGYRQMDERRAIKVLLRP